MKHLAQTTISDAIHRWPTRSQIKAQAKAKTEAALALNHISKKDLLAKLGVAEKWIDARVKDDACGFPKPFKVNGRFHWSRRAIDRWLVETALRMYR